ncbi:hypothetical protein BO94DRAFT_43490 [Aspergillus sclerotioniger CBS 115572]|uniref:Uncharacterized protein n=1 Tax=Aspergillus sclerotioniger CBS 115572 TaxID=1450535 RepID=A0A317WUA6_9EURO|nr:hypothetical protein BO94DRAFT_43490 [Aspergillus sclerotioniger CBS 115572]PWY89665.1 hypothetical protein BO94DRAFT_43490 [Aspergillus sclerotioniger CBS 115572]
MLAETEARKHDQPDSMAATNRKPPKKTGSSEHLDSLRMSTVVVILFDCIRQRDTHWRDSPPSRSLNMAFSHPACPAYLYRSPTISSTCMAYPCQQLSLNVEQAHEVSFLPFSRFSTLFLNWHVSSFLAYSVDSCQFLSKHKPYIFGTCLSLNHEVLPSLGPGGFIFSP